MPEEDYLLFAHSTAAGVASVSIWECMRTLIEGGVLIAVSMALSTITVHLLYRHHKRLRAKLRH
jgi:hypothetical protein